MKAILIMLSIFISADLLAQEVVTDETETGNVEVIADQRIDRLIDRRAEFHKIDSSQAGFRIQIFSTTDRQDVMLAKENFLLNYPELAIYMKYDSPNFKLRVGDFKTKLEAQYWFNKLQEEYPTLFLVPDKVYP